ncbi:hypothetical protein [Streptomyces sp. NPDC048361]|uniref:hypothetical protein n=1 Tax=Streptomyces sp. NPDC048361 TaxID=3154720 RepID=UPI00343A2486
MQPSESPSPSSPSPASDHEPGSMVGLFWVTGDAVYLGTPPAAGGGGVQLTVEGVRLVRATEDAPHRDWRWSELLEVRVNDAPTRSAAVRWATHALSVGAAVFDLWVPGEPPSMTVTLTPKKGDDTTAEVLSGAAVAYSPREVDLSLGLLARFVRGESSPTVPIRWWNEVRPARVLRSRDREAVLEEWSHGTYP